jgi:peptidoglycan/xylan/chitin deacetylase (PgdA/CDA1 family)
MLTVLLVGLSGALLLNGYTHHLFGSAPDGSVTATGPHDEVPAAIARGGPVIDAGQGAARSVRPKARTIAITFDDGPDPAWTPKVLDLLKAQGVKATFFVIGTEVAAHPDLARRIVAEGHQIGVHTFTHANLSSAPGWRRSLELRQSQLILAGATGVSTPLLRPPYSSEPDALTNADWTSIKRARDAGYLTVLTTKDSEDWRRPGTAQVIANSTPKGTAGEVLLMHDAGGDRSQTLAALQKLIPVLKARGFRFATVSDAVGMPQPVHPAGSIEHARGVALIGAMRLSDGVLPYSPGSCTPPGR